MKIAIEFEINSCKDCPMIESGRTYGNDGRDGKRVYKCKKRVFGGECSFGYDVGLYEIPENPPYGCPYIKATAIDRVASKLNIKSKELEKILESEKCEIKDREIEEIQKEEEWISKEDRDKKCNDWKCDLYIKRRCLIPCGKCYNGKCEQCTYGYMSIVEQLRRKYSKEELEKYSKICGYARLALVYENE